MRKNKLATLVVLLGIAPAVFADQITLKNGDHLSGKVVKSDGKTLILHTEFAGDVTLKFDAALPGKVEPGTELSFEGVPQSYTATPFMVVFNVDKDKLHGWTGKNAPGAPAPHHKTLTSKR